MQTIANDPVMDIFAKLDLKTIALLLDVDGTIIDIGPSPTEVQVSGALLESLKRLFELTGGAVALVSGRPLGDLDRLFAPLHLPAVGGHGAEMRVRDNEVFYWTKPLPHGSAAETGRRAEHRPGHRCRGQRLFVRAALSEGTSAGRTSAPARGSEPDGVCRRAD